AVFAGTGTVRQSGGTMSYTNAIALDLARFQVTGGTLTADGPITNLTVTGGTFGGTGNLSGLVMMSSGTLAGNKVLAGTLNWLGGTISGALTVVPGGAVAVDGTALRTLSGTLTNAGLVTWSGTNTWRMSGSGLLVNEPAGTVDLLRDGTLEVPSGSPAIVNAGLWRKSAGAGTTAVQPPFTNVGVVESQSGTLRFNGGGWVDGSFSAASGAAVEFGFGTWLLQPGAVFAGTGTVRQSGGTMSYAAAAMKDLTRLLLDSGSLIADGPITNLTVTGGTLGGNGSLSGTINLGSGGLSGNKLLLGTLNWTNGTVSGTVTVAGNAVARWHNGTISGAMTIASGGLLAVIEGTLAFRTLSGTLTNAGLVSWTDNTAVWRMRDGGFFLNEPTGIMEILNNATLQLFAGTADIVNAGLWRKSAGGGTTTISVPFANLGTVEVLSGTISFSGGGEINGNYSGASGTTLQFASGTWTLQPTVQFTGDGLFRISGGNVTYAGVNYDLDMLQMSSGSLTVNGTISDFVQAGGTLAGTHTITGTLTMTGGAVGGTSTIAGALNWTNGTVSGTVNIASNAIARWHGGTLNGALTIASGGWLAVLEGPAVFKTHSGALTNAGLLTWNDTAVWRMRENGLLVNQGGGVFDSLTNATLQLFAETPSIINAGLWRKSAGGGTTTISVPFANLGAVEVLSGTLSFSGGGEINGSYSATSGTTLQFTSGTWTLSPTVQFSGDGLFRISGGNVTYAGPSYDFNLLQMSGGTLTINGGIASLAIAGGTLAGTHTVTGTLNVGSGTMGGNTTVSGQLNWTSGTLGGAVTVAANGLLRWSGGTLSGALTVLPGGELAVVEGTAIRTLSGMLTNAGLVSWSDPNIWRMSGNGRWFNEAGGTLEALGNGTLQLFSGTPAVANSGVWRKRLTSGTTTISVPFTNHGAIEACSGTLRFTGALTLAPTGILSYPLAGRTAGTDFGLVTIVGNPTLGGALSVSLTDGFVPNYGDRFRILNWGIKRGGFAQAIGFDLVDGLYFQGLADKTGLSLVTQSTLAPPPPPPTNLINQVVAFGDPAVFAFSPPGVEPFTYQWTFHGTNLPGQTNASLIIPNVQTAQFGTYCAVVTDAFNVTRISCATLSATDPPNINTQPTNVVAEAGVNVVLAASAAGGAPLRYQWRINGENIPGATNSTYTINNAQPGDGGLYSVLVANPVRVISSANARVQILSPALPFADNFAARVSTNSFSGLGSGDTSLATVESGEPEHAGKPGGRSVWLEWIAPADGVATFSTRGSAFDTLLGVYVGTNPVPSVTGLALVAEDDDRGGFFTSEASFNATAGTAYLIAVDGFAGRGGDLVLGWNLDTNLTAVPRIIQHPRDVTVVAGETAQFDVFAVSSAALSYQWVLGGWLASAGATNATLTIPNASYLDVGNYSVEVTAAGQTVESRSAALEIGPLPDAQSFNKLEDLLTLAEGAIPPPGLVRASGGGGFPSVSIGTIGSQLINNFNSTTQQGEPIHSAVIGGSSRWYLLTAQTNGTLVLDTLGSDIDTVLAVYTGSDIFSLVRIASDNNGAPDGVRSLVKFPAVSGTRYLIAVDGVNGAQGNVNLNWRMGIPPNPTGPAQNLIVAGGASLLLSAGVSNNVTSPVYQWRRNGVIIPSATNATYFIPNLQFDQVGSYSVLVSNLVGEVVNAIATVSAQTPLALGLGSDGFQVTGSAAETTVLELSTNLTVWTPVYTNTTPLLPVSFTDTNAFRRTEGFYRLQPWP
ncbi:MAG: immunoglobulin domain-containing protein, partial [Verrucomicrobia bacterium]|nr:immunoglobulin domain-containing protein [Verrucomicrobiota bacterium]